MQFERLRKYKNWKENGSWFKNCIVGKINMGYFFDYYGYYFFMFVMYLE